MEIGVFSFGDVLPHPVTGDVPSHADKMRDLVRLGKLADEVGLDVFAVGEHHRLDMVVSSPAVVLAAIAQATSQIKLSSATTLLNTLDPVRVFEDFATLDLLSNGRAELILGRGSFTESWELFGLDRKDYDARFAEHLDLIMKLNESERVTWDGHFRPALKEAEISPRPTRPLPFWVGVGGTPGSAYRAGQLGLAMNMAILGQPAGFRDLVAVWEKGAQDAGRERPQLAASSHGLLMDDADAAKEAFMAHWGTIMRKGLRNRFPPRDIPREYLELEAGPSGAFFAGDAETIIAKARWQRDLFGLDRLLLNVDWGGVPFEDAARSIEILGREVAPALRDTTS